jgi:hypothetical protein
MVTFYRKYTDFSEFRLQSKTGCRVRVSNNGDYYPGTNDRVVLVTGTVCVCVCVCVFVLRAYLYIYIHVNVHVLKHTK